MVVKDYGEITVPRNWGEVKLKHFQALLKATDGEEQTDAKVIAALTEKDEDWVRQLPIEFVERIKDILQFLSTDIADEPSDTVKLKGKEYKIHHTEKLRFGEYCDVNTVVQSDRYDYASILAILCRRDGELYDDDFVADKFDERREMFSDAPMTKVYPLIAFFLTLHIVYNGLLQGYLTNGVQAASRLLTDIEDSQTVGVGLGHSMLWRMRTWWQRRKLRKCISRLS